MRISGIALLLVVIGCGSAAAADVAAEVSPDIDQARFGWTGFYAGAAAGYGRIKDVDYGPPPGLPNPFYDKGDDWSVGGYAGYLYQFDNFVVGAEAEATRLDITYENFNFITVQNAYAVKARAGYAIDRFLVSGHLGAAYVNTNYLSLADWGYDVGVNVDYAVTDHLVVGGQYSHLGFKKFDGTLIDADVDLISARVGWKF